MCAGWQDAVVGTSMEVLSHAWVFDLVSSDDRLRQAALRRHREHLVQASEALTLSHRVWLETGMRVPREPHLAAEMERAYAAYLWHYDQTVFQPIDMFVGSRNAGPAAHEKYAPYAALFLQWENDHPDTWRDAAFCSPWTTKAFILDRFSRNGVPDNVRGRLTELVLAAIRRSYRCKDWCYATLVRHLADDRLLDALRTSAEDTDSFTRRRAGFLLHVARHPEERVKYGSWHHWLALDSRLARETS
jgi:hypothetical protein